MTAGEAGEGLRREQTAAASDGNECSGTGLLMERVLARPNMLQALKRVRQNRGAPGVDGMTVDTIKGWLIQHWKAVRKDLLAGSYEPAAVRKVSIPKRSGGERVLGIPTVLDRLIQQAILQVLQPAVDPTFSEHSHGFRPGRNAHDAIRSAQAHVAAGREWVVDIDLEKFFDTVNHDVLMSRLAARITDRRVLRLIRQYLRAGMLTEGVAVPRSRGTPQGGPLSPLLANILLDEVDKELERRGHAFARYADDLRIFCRSQRAAQRAMTTTTQLFNKLRLRVNPSKSAVAKATERPFLGFSLWKRREGPRIVASEESLERLKTRVRQITRRTRGYSLQFVIDELRRYLNGWRGYFGIAVTPGRFRQLDGWIRRRLRSYLLHQWRRGPKIHDELTALGIPRRMAAAVATNSGRWWKMSKTAANYGLRNSYFDGMGLPRLAA